MAVSCNQDLGRKRGHIYYQRSREGKEVFLTSFSYLANLIPCKAVGIGSETKTAGRELFTRIDFYSIPNMSLHIPKREDPGTQNLKKLFSGRNTIYYFNISGPFNGNSQIIICSSITTTTTTIAITVINFDFSQNRPQIQERISLCLRNFV